MECVPQEEALISNTNVQERSDDLEYNKEDEKNRLKIKTLAHCLENKSKIVGSVAQVEASV